MIMPPLMPPDAWAELSRILLRESQPPTPVYLAHLATLVDLLRDKILRDAQLAELAAYPGFTSVEVHFTLELLRDLLAVPFDQIPLPFPAVQGVIWLIDLIRSIPDDPALLRSILGACGEGAAGDGLVTLQSLGNSPAMQSLRDPQFIGALWQIAEMLRTPQGEISPLVSSDSSHPTSGPEHGLSADDKDWIYSSQNDYAKARGYRGQRPGLFKEDLEDGTIAHLEQHGKKFRYVMSDPKIHQEVKAELKKLRENKGVRKPRT